MLKSLVLVALLFVATQAKHHRKRAKRTETNFYEQFKFHCPHGQVLSELSSWHSGRDRQWTFGCRRPLISSLASHTCFWSDFVNNYDGYLNYRCPYDGVIAGVGAIYDHLHRDRRFQFNCCHLTMARQSGTRTSGWLNNFEHWLEYQEIYPGTFIIGFESEHNNYFEDRRFKVVTAMYT